MENKTDKPYSLQDAKDEVSKKYGYTDWQDMYIQDNRPLNYHVDEMIILYASKATEELRKENEALKQSLQASERFRVQDAVTHIKEQNDVRSYLNPTLKKVSEDDLKKALHEVSEKNKAIRDSYTDGSNQSELLSEIERLKESNKELVEALRYARKAIAAVNSMGATTAILSRLDNVIQKSEGDVNKKI